MPAYSRMKELRIDRDRAIRVAAAAGLALIGVSLLPGLLRGPEAPAVPPDVGFLPADRIPAKPVPGPEGQGVGSRRSAHLAARRGTSSSGRSRARDGKSGPRGANHHRAGAGRRDTGKREKPGAKPADTAPDSAPAPASATGSPSAQASPSAASLESAAPAQAPPPQPAAAPSTTARPGSGSPAAGAGAGSGSGGGGRASDTDPLSAGSRDGSQEFTPR